MKSFKSAVIIILLFVAECFVYFHSVPAINLLPGWRDAPNDISFEEAQGDIKILKSNRNNANIPLPVPKAVASEDNYSDHSTLLDACAKKFGGNVSNLQNSFLRIPEMTRNLFVAREKRCRGILESGFSEGNCVKNLKCVSAVVKLEHNAMYQSDNNDDEYTLYMDAKAAAFAYRLLTKKNVSYRDVQDSSLKKNWERFVNSGYARFNINDRETESLRRSIKNAIKHGKLTQSELLLESILAAKGNFTMGAGSLAQIFHDDRRLVSKIKGMRYAAGKNYYRFVGMYVGLHESALIRSLGQIAGYANIAGNPIAYGVPRVCKDFWKATKFALKYYGLSSDSKAEPVDFKETVRVFGPDGRGNYIDKFPEYTKGLSAGILYRKN